MSVHTVDERLFKEAGEPWAHAGALLSLLQLSPDTSDIARDGSDGGWINKSRLGHRRSKAPLPKYKDSLVLWLRVLFIDEII